MNPEVTSSNQKQTALINLKDANEAIKTAVVVFKSHEESFLGECARLSAFDEITDLDGRNLAHKAISEANKIIKQYASARLGVTRPIDQLKRDIMAHEKAETLELRGHIQRITEMIGAYDAKVELERQKELARIAAERKAYEEEQAAERKRVSEIKNSMANIELNFTKRIGSAQSSSELTAIAKDLVIVKNENFEEFEDEALEMIDRLIQIGKSKRLQLIEIEKMRAIEAERLEKEGAEAARIAELERQNKEREMEARRKRQQLEAEQREVERLRQEKEKERLRLEAEQRRREEEQARIEALNAERLKGVTSGIDKEKTVVTDITKLNKRFYSVKLNLVEIKKAIKAGEEIEGLDVYFKSGLILNG